MKQAIQEKEFEMLEVNPLPLEYETEEQKEVEIESLNEMITQLEEEKDVLYKDGLKMYRALTKIHNRCYLESEQMFKDFKLICKVEKLKGF